MGGYGGGNGLEGTNTAIGTLIVNGNIGHEGYSSTYIGDFTAIKSDAFQNITITGNINITDPYSNNKWRGCRGLIMRNLATGSVVNPTLTFNGNILVTQYHGHGANYYPSYIIYQGSSSATINGQITINGNTQVNNGTYCYGVWIDQKTDININGDIIQTFNFSYGVRIQNNASATITFDATTAGGTFTGNTNGSAAWNFPPVRISDSDSLTININGHIGDNFLMLGWNSDNPTTSTPVNNSTVNVLGDLLGGNSGYNIRMYYYCNNNTINIVGNIYSGPTSVNPSLGVYKNARSNTTLNITGAEIHGGNTAAVYYAIYDKYFYATINATEIAADPTNTSKVGHAIQSTSRYLGWVKINATRILDNLLGTSALFLRSYTLDGTPSEAYIRYAAIPSIGGTVVHSSLNSISTFSMPPPSAVRAGVAYGSGGSFVGTCEIPSVSAVLFGVPVGAADGTVGTGILDQSLLNYNAIYNAPLSAFTVPGSVGERLKEQITIETVGKLIESFNYTP